MTQFASTLYPQTNPTNPVLLELGDDLPADRFNGVPFLESVQHSLDACKRTWWAPFEATDAQIAHARRVLTRLVSLSG